MNDDRPKIVLVDFDGVLHSYTSGWQGADVVSDPPVLEAIEWLQHLVEDPGLDVRVYSARSQQEGGIPAMKTWLEENGFPGHLLHKLGFPWNKPAAWLTIDDRAIRFEGEFPTVQEIHDFRPWYTKGEPYL